MRRVVLIIFYVLFLCGCKEEPVTEYYRLVYTPPSEYVDVFGMDVVNEPKVEVKRVADYKSDSIAIASEREWVEGWMMFLPSEREKAIAEENRRLPENMREASTRSLNDLYDRMEQEKHTLVIIRHYKDFDRKELLKIVREHGILSKEAVKYMQEHNIEVDTYELN